MSRASDKPSTTWAPSTATVGGKPTWTLARDSAQNLPLMLQCCEAELRNMADHGVVAAPFYFERVAILLRKAKRYKEEVEMCERYAGAIEQYYQETSSLEQADVRQSPWYRELPARLAKARALLSTSG
ncbi:MULTISPECIES: hypothetical protein [unclassified Variovorax]|uniref:hypothetical protein n=1 Tax=unclassified Variovorax TaxID=663243 RepID=UPI00083814A9|nr:MULTISPECIES: hypothetical protein [unclassified Variovorax]PNG50414.1 hypothetical protein CHC06_06038 [Variovorax sp. B2]PNG51287.1 hypothetical protein CHC07_05944 [Variovorax sp. B4]VTV17539.1 hypothetical protein WDL1P1_00469 [Variovorax sp. WDL1]